MIDDHDHLGRVGDRPFWVRSVSVFVRAVHLLAASAVAGAFILGHGETLGHAWWAVAGLSGVLLLGTEGMRHRELYRETAGHATALKLTLIAAIAFAPGIAVWLMSAAVVVAALGAHAPRRWRHRRIL